MTTLWLCAESAYWGQQLHNDCPTRRERRADPNKPESSACERDRTESADAYAGYALPRA